MFLVLWDAHMKEMLPLKKLTGLLKNFMKWVIIKIFWREINISIGCYEISLGDTIGVGTPEKTHKLFQAIKNIPKERLAAHFHDTYDKAIQNLLAALEVNFVNEK